MGRKSYVACPYPVAGGHNVANFVESVRIRDRSSPYVRVNAGENDVGPLQYSSVFGGRNDPSNDPIRLSDGGSPQDDRGKKQE